MESNIKTHVITPLKGICNSPSELTCDDEQLNKCDGLTFSNGELQPIQLPEYVLSAKGLRLKFVHDYNNADKGQRYIFSKNSSVLAWKYLDDDTEKDIKDLNAEILQIKAIGNTLIVNTTKGMEYILWKNQDYKYIGSRIPQPDFIFSMDYPVITEAKSSANGMYETFQVVFPDGYKPDNSNNIRIKDEKKADFENLYEGLYGEAKKKMADEGAFCNPFFVRGGIRLYDGSYAFITNPILMYPIVGSNNCFKLKNGELKISLVGCRLCVTQTTDYTDFKDIVEDVVVFASQQIETNEKMFEHQGDTWQYLSEGNRNNTHSGYKVEDFRYAFYGDNVKPHLVVESVNVLSHEYYRFYAQKNLLEKEYENISNFYLLCKLGTQGILRSYDNPLGKLLLSPDYDDNAIDDIVNQPRLDHDDYYGWVKLIPASIETLNRRLVASEISRAFFSGFSHFTNIQTLPASEYWAETWYEIQVTIGTDIGDKIVRTTVITQEAIANGFWYYFPDPRAKMLKIFVGNKLVMQTELKEHPFLNGAYAANNTPTLSIMGMFPYNKPPEHQAPSVPPQQDIGRDPDIGPDTDYLGNYIIQSPVDNPFIFHAESYNRVGSGTILGIAGLTTALSQDAYKVSTTLCFTTQGIWAIRSNDEGMFSSVAPAFSREVCTNPESITMTDNAVFFVSKKGLMCVTGTSEASVVCVSEALRGNDHTGFNAFIQRAEIAYDYVGGNLVLFDGSEVWIYNIKSGTFSTCSDFIHESEKTNDAPYNVCTDYPDSLLQYHDGSIYSLYDKKDRNNDENNYSGTLESRAMKLSGSVYLKSLRRVRHLMTFNDEATFSFVLYGSNDLKSWHRLYSIGGKPYRFFKFKYKFQNLKATDIFSGLLLEAQTRHSDKPH